MKRFPSDAEVFAAARQLHDHDLQDIWHVKNTHVLPYDELDFIGKEEFDAVIERIVMAAEEHGFEAGARQLYQDGGFYGWWGNPPLEWDVHGYDKMGPAERVDFDGAVDRLLKAAAEARGNS